MVDARLVYGMSEAEYHSDPCDVPCLSASVAKTLIDRSPAHAFLEHPKLGGKARVPTASMDHGTLVHTLLLGRGTEVVSVEAKDWKTKAAQTAREEARADGRVAILAHEIAEAKAAVEIIRQKLRRFGIELDGESEVAAFWTETTSDGVEVRCRAKFDHLKLDFGLIPDLKTIRSAHPHQCQKQMAELGYDIQAAAYTSALEKCHPELLGRVSFMPLFCELEPPHCVTPARVSGSLRELGRMRWQRAIDTWERCLRTNHWPDYVEQIINIEAPTWAINKETDNHANL